MPRGSSGLYFMSMHFVTNDNKYVYMRMWRNSEILCGSYEDSDHNQDNGAGSCSVTVELNAGKEK